MQLKIPLTTVYLFAVFATGSAQPTQDSAKKAETSLTVKFASVGIFTYAGCIANHNSNIDITLLHSSGSASFFLERGIDLQNFNSGINYTYAGVYKEVVVSKKLSFAPAIGYVAGQAPGSPGELDVIATFSYKASPILAIEYLSMFSGVMQNCGGRAMFNRLKITSHARIFDINFYVWQAPALWNNTAQLSISPEMVFQKLKIASHVSLVASAGYFKVLATGKASVIKNSFIFTVAAPIGL